MTAASCPPKLVAGTSRHRFVWGCLPISSALECRPCPFQRDPCPEPELEPYGGGRRTPRSAPSSRVGHTPGDNAITHSAPASSILPEASRAPYHHDHQGPLWSGPPRAPLPKTCYWWLSLITREKAKRAPACSPPPTCGLPFCLALTPLHWAGRDSRVKHLRTSSFASV